MTKGLGERTGPLYFARSCQMDNLALIILLSILQAWEANAWLAECYAKNWLLLI